MEYNILLLSAGRRVELVKCFQKAAKKLQINSKIIAADLSDTAPALYFSDSSYQIPRIGTEGYLEKIIEICEKENIALIVPTIDTELLILSENKEMLEERTKARVLVSDYPIIEICRNKIRSQKFFEEHNFLVPRQIKDIEKDNFSYPVFIKPLDGSSSINAFAVNNEKELKFFTEYIENPIIQEYVRGEEYTIDVFLDFDSNILSVVPRKRLAVRSGEIAKGKIVKDRVMIEEVKRLMEILRPIGHITVQCMKTEQGIYFIEINPRFGGGAPMSMEAGADSCEKLYRILNNEKLEYSEDYRDDLLFLRFDSSIVLDENKVVVQ